MYGRGCCALEGSVLYLSGTFTHSVAASTLCEVILFTLLKVVKGKFYTQR